MVYNTCQLSNYDSPQCCQNWGESIARKYAGGENQSKGRREYRDVGIDEKKVKCGNSKKVIMFLKGIYTISTASENVVLVLNLGISK